MKHCCVRAVAPARGTRPRLRFTRASAPPTPPRLRASTCASGSYRPMIPHYPSRATTETCVRLELRERQECSYSPPSPFFCPRQPEASERTKHAQLQQVQERFHYSGTKHTTVRRYATFEKQYLNIQKTCKEKRQQSFDNSFSTLQYLSPLWL